MLPPSAAHTTRTRPYRVLAVVVAVIGLLAGLARTASATTVPASRSTSSAFTLTSSVAPSRLPTLVGPETRVGAADLPPSLFVGSGRSVLAGHVGQTCPAYDGFVVGSCVATNTGGKPGQQQLFDTEPYDLVPESAPKPLGRGSTGSARPNNLNEQLAMNEARSNPGAGQPVPVKGGMADSRWPASEGWVKMRQNVNSVEVHYVQNTKTGAVDDFKFK